MNYPPDFPHPKDEKNPTIQEYIAWKIYQAKHPNQDHWNNFYIYAHFIFDDISLNTQSIVAKEIHMKQSQLSPLMGILKIFKMKRCGVLSLRVKHILNSPSQLLDKA